MHGFQKSPKSKWLYFIGSLVVLACAIILGCAGTEESERSETSEGTLKEFLAKYEKTFRPSAYNLDVNLIKAEEQRQYTTLHAATVYTTTASETIPGFRVQVLLTQEIDEANTTLSDLELQFPEEFAYMVYDAPYYKVRVGNFPVRTAANTKLKKLIKLGYKEAWIVPDNILKNPPPKLPDTFIEPKRFIDNR